MRVAGVHAILSCETLGLSLSWCRLARTFGCDVKSDIVAPLICKRLPPKLDISYLALATCPSYALDRRKSLLLLVVPHHIVCAPPIVLVFKVVPEISSQVFRIIHTACTSLFTGVGRTSEPNTASFRSFSIVFDSKREEPTAPSCSCRLGYAVVGRETHGAGAITRS